MADPAKARRRDAELRKREGDHWSVTATFAGEEPMRAEPFDAIEIPLGRLWAEGPNEAPTG